MTKEGFNVNVEPLPTAPPPPYESLCAQPAYNPNMQTAASPYTYQPAPVIHETPQQASRPYPTQAPLPNHQYSVTVSSVFVPLPVGNQSLRTNCPNCGEAIKTRTISETKGIAHLFCLGLFLVGCCLCSCIPYCMDSMREIRHICPKCKAHLGTYRP